MIVKRELIFYFILAFAIIIRVFLFTGLEGSDDLQYNIFAYETLNVEFSEIIKEALSSSDFAQLRLALYLPVSVFFLLFGVNELSSNLYPFLCSMGILIIVYKLGVLIFNKRAGFIAMALYAIFPIEVVYATRLYPEMPLSLFMGLSVYLFLKYEKQNNNNKAGSLFYLFFSGIFIGLAYLTKITGILVIGFYVSYFIYKLQFKPRYMYIISGFITIILSEMAFYYFQTGDLFHHYHLMKLGNKMLIEATPHISSGWAKQMGWFRAFGYYPSIMFNPLYLFSIFYYGVFLAIFCFLLKKQRETYAVIIWFLVIMGALNFGIRTLSPLVFITGKPRHLMLVSIPLVLLLGYFLSLAKTRKWKILALIFAVVLVLTSAWALKMQYYHQGRNISYNSREIYKYLKNADKTIYTDQRTKWNLQYLGGYTGDLQITEFNSMDFNDLKSISDCYVAINWNWINKSKKWYSWTFPEEIYSPPENWKFVKFIENSKPRGTGIVVGLRKILGFESKTKVKQKNEKVSPEKSKNAYIYYAPVR